MLGFLLNLPYTLAGVVLALVSGPTSLTSNKNPRALIFKVSKLWWAVGYMRGARAMAVGHAVLLGPNLEDKDLEHELVHVEQFARMPLVHPFLYYTELLRKGYRANKYEDEAYRRAGNVYKDK
ncbi:MAG: hypothetical protein AAB955_02245 [Patescibacteria group bacterium]